MIIAFLFFIDVPLYLKLTLEDGPIEWLTFSSLLLSAIVSIIIARGIKRHYHYNHWFFILFFFFAILAAGEEISWGQRIFGFKTTEFFKTHSDQPENNLHNAFQGIVGIKTKHIAFILLFVWGVILPLFYKKGKFKKSFLGERTLIIPPAFLIPAFIIAGFCMFDFPTEQEEEFGEFFYSLIFVFFMLNNYILFKRKVLFQRAIK